MFFKMLFAACAFALLGNVASADEVPPAFAPLAFLLGDWSGSGTSDAGSGSGGDSFHLDLAGHVLVRRAHSEYPGKDGKPGVNYESLMVIYADPPRPGLRADYYDNGHVIHYAVVPGTAPRVAAFLSDAAPGAPVFRLTYTGSADGKSLGVKFEIMPPGSSSFTTLAEGLDTRAAAKTP